MKNKTQKLVYSAMLAALACVATMLIKFPSPLKGYINMGDCVVLLIGWVLPPLYGFGSAGVGSALADVFSGYAMYAPATFVIKGLMALAAYFIHKLLSNKNHNVFSRIISGAIAEVIMIAGYYVYEGFLYGFVSSAVNIPFNAVQGLAGLAAGVFLIRIFEKNKIIHF